MQPLTKRTILAAVAAGIISVPLVIGGPAQAAEAKTIGEIQGAGHLSSYDGQEVTDIPGIVTAVGEDGFWLQSIEADDDPATSEAIFVYTKDAPDVTEKDKVTVTGTVKEYRAGDADGANLTVTQIMDAEISADGTGELPEAVKIGEDGLQAPEKVHTTNPGDVEESGEFDPEANALDFYESLEGMVVSVSDAQAVSPTSKHGEISVLPSETDGVRTERGGIKLTEDDVNTELLTIDGDLAEMPSVNVGDTLTGDVVGVMDYDFGIPRIHAFDTPDVESGDLKPEQTDEQGEKLAVATYNVENLDPTDDAETFAAHGETIAKNLQSPDIVAVEEIQDNNGAEDDGTVAADKTFEQLIEAISDAGGKDYEYAQIDPENNQDGGEPGGNIRVGFLYDPQRVDFEAEEGGDATTPVEVGEDGLSFNPGRIAPEDEAWDSSRKPLVGEFTYSGEKVYVVANHFASKGGDDPIFGRYQPANRSSEDQRHQQAELVNEFVQELRQADENANVVVLGDINDFEFSETVEKLTADGALMSGYELIEEQERYSYIFNGNSQVLDQALISENLKEKASLDVVHVNVEFANQTSDHDPSVLTLQF